MCLAFSNSRLRVADRFLPARLMKNWIMRMPEPMPLGLTFLLAMARAMVCASFVNKPLGGNVETVFTSRTHRFFSTMVASSLLDPDGLDVDEPAEAKRGPFPAITR